MRDLRTETVLTRLRTLFVLLRDDPRSDEELLGRFAEDHDEDAFSAVVGRHAPLVWRTCCRVLGEGPDAEDAFQVTFLTLARWARKQRHGALAGWLFQVARRAALDVRAAAERRRRLECQRAVDAGADRGENPDRAEIYRLLDEELAELPEKLRVPLVLRYLEGKTLEEVARILGCSRWAVSRRLTRGEGILRERLGCRGVTVGAGALAGLLAGTTVGAASVRSRLIAETTRQAVACCAGTLHSPAAQMASALLPDKVSWVFKSWLLVLLGIGALFAGAVGWWGMSSVPAAPSSPASGDNARSQGTAAKPRLDRHGDPLPPGALARLGTVRLRHNLWVHSLLFTPDGKGLVTAGGDNLPKLWDMATGKLLREFNALPKPQILDGRYCEVLGATLSPDGRILAARSGQLGSLYLLETATGKLLHVFKNRNGNGGNNSSLNFAFSPDGKVIAAQLDGQLELRDVAADRILWQQKEPDLAGLAFSPDGKTLASASGTDGVRLWNARTGELSRTLGPKAGIHRLVFSPDGRTLAVGYEPTKEGRFYSVHLWDVATGKETRRLGEPDKPIAFPAFSPDGKLMATCGGGAIRLWDAATGKELCRCPNTYVVWSPVVFSPDSKVLAAMDGPLLRFWEAASGKALPVQLPTGHEGMVNSVAFTPDGQTLISAAGDHTVRWWDTRTGRQRRNLTFSSQPRRDYPKAVLSPDGTMLATLYPSAPDGADHTGEVFKGLRGGIRLWDAATGKEHRHLDCGDGCATEGAFSPDGKLLAEVFCAADGQSSVVRLWEVATGKCREHTLAGTCPVYFPDGLILATLEGEMDKTISFWEAATGQKIRSVRTTECIQCLALSPDGKALATGSDRITLYPLSRDKQSGVQVGAPRQVAYPPHWAITALAFSADGRMLASSGSDHAIHLWETASGKERVHFHGHGIAVTDMGCGVTSLSFSAEGRRLASGSADSTILIWDVTGRMRDGAWRAVTLANKELENLWTDLASSDATRAGRAIWTLVAGGSSTVSFLKTRLRPTTAPVTAEAMDQLLADLDADDFSIREKARRELAKLGEACEPALRQALTRRPSLEMRRSLQQLLFPLEEARNNPSGQVLRGMRAVEVLEQIGTPEARQVLKSLMAGAAVGCQTREARAALERLERGYRR